MKTLVLNIDRDDDFGRKAEVKSPVIGLDKNIDAANKLGQADPEDSDLNAIFSAISTYKKLKEEKKEVEIATICGHINVGIKSDEIIAEQLEQVIKETQVDNVILVTDGAEDEYILPIIQSRIKVSAIQRVSVKQSRELEDTYYRILKILADQKVQKQFVLPIALVLIVWAFFVLLGMAASGFGAILLTLGLYLLIRVFRWEKLIAVMWQEVKTGFMTGRLSVYTSIIAAVIIVATAIMAYYEVINSTFSSDAELLPVILFVKNMIWGIVVAGLIMVSGRSVDMYLREKKAPWNYWMVPFSLVAFGLISYVIFNAFNEALKSWPERFLIEPFQNFTFIFYIVSGILIAVIGAITYHYIKDIYTTEEKKLEIERQTEKLIEKN